MKPHNSGPIIYCSSITSRAKVLVVQREDPLLYYWLTYWAVNVLTEGVAPKNNEKVSYQKNILP